MQNRQARVYILLNKAKILIKDFRSKVFRKILLTFIILFILFLLFIFPNLGRWLVVKDELSNSDLILVLAGSFPDRVLHSIYLYNQQYGEKIVFVESCKGEHNDKEGEVVEIPQGYAQLNEAFAIKSGIPEEGLLILNGDARSTRDEAMRMKVFLSDNEEVASIILVTSKYHSRRAKRVFVNLLSSLNRNIKIYSSPSEYDRFNGAKWWEDKKDIKLVLSEYFKLIYSYLL